MLLSLEIVKVEPLADGAAFGAVGPYERVIAVARGEVDPSSPANSGIALIDKAPRNAAGKVEYATSVFILRPKDSARGNGRILYEVNNRGRKMLFGNIADGPQGVNDPKTLADLGNAFPLRLGYTIVWSGWDPDAPRANMGLALTAPVATDNGQPIVQTVREEWVSGTRVGVLEAFKLSHEAATLEQPRARLTVRERADDEPRELPLNQWSFVDARSIRLREGTQARPGFLYEFHYEAKNPKVQGLGFAATRDVVSWLRHAPAAVKATGRPMTHALAIGFSQAGRYLRNHISEGFNRDEQGRRVFDGVHSHIAGVGRVFFNTPFAQPARTNTQHEDHGFPENEFPFSTATLGDPLTGRSGSLFRGDGSDPLLIETNTSTEYWQKGASLLHTDPLGTTDVTLPENSRVYMIAGTQHGGPRWRHDRSRPEPQSAQPAQSDAGGPRPAGRPRCLGGVGHRTASQPRADARRRHTGRGRQYRLPRRAGRRDRAHHQHRGAARRLGEARGSGKDLSNPGEQGRRRRQRGRGHPPARHRRAARDLHRLERVQAALPGGRDRRP